jgi:hypothetical protein
MLEPNLIIFRHNSVNDAFVELRYLDSFLLPFGDIVNGYSYPNLCTNEIIVGRLTPTGSTELGRFIVSTMKPIYELQHSELNSIVKTLITMK